MTAKISVAIVRETSNFDAMKPGSSRNAFTLIEVVTVIAIILALTGLVIGLSGYVQSTGAKARCNGEIQMLRAAAVSYQVEFGSFPQNEDTDALMPTVNFDPTSSVYVRANLHLYRELTGDREPKDNPDFQYTTSDETEAIRFLKEFEPRILNTDRDSATKAITRVRFIQDPWGFPYGYSTRGISQEQLYQKEVRAGRRGARKTGDTLGGFNTAEFDLWSTGGSKPTVPPTGDLRSMEWAKWIKNW